ncbi:hypothetical protein G5I_10647 [Acromyrmex echinatior]|uniref:Uncharacterized protein n=1 Tax=Acromyrmex echinatior TaxID=103372 RepID=F4WXG2_ACREC|nr:hypothetical protein G5I_10647 [Acromyrmex echinatior]
MGRAAFARSRPPPLGLAISVRLSVPRLVLDERVVKRSYGWLAYARAPATMQICGAGPYDQHIMLGEHELIDDSLSLAALGIFPGALLTLKIFYSRRIDWIKAFQARLVLDFATGPAPWHAQ